ncbi:nucleoside phosphorylase domain-containing protein [Mariannaea sp. PMI_226]|nr:nucleoside phosphorylase domain-containing protein [Mariannaea sp. PMI_226]
MTARTAESQPFRPTMRLGFEIAIICALTLEADAVDALFDLHWDDDGPPFDKAPGDPNAYSTGAIGRHNVVLAHMPGMGKANASAVAANCRISFPNIRLALVVGVCGVIPFGPSGEAIVLGDVIISDGVIQYDFGWRLPDCFVRKDILLDSLGRPNAEIRGLLAKLKGIRHRKQLISNTIGHLETLRREPLLQAEYPGVANDRLFVSAYRHVEAQKSCEQLGCNGKLVPRLRLEASQGCPQPTVHFGLIASGDSVMKCGEDRDAIAKAEGVIAFEMEGTGVWDSFPCIVIKSACDYADSHKSKVWQRYAAATAAACMKAFLSHWVPSVSVGIEGEEFSSIRRRAVHSIPFPKNPDFVGRIGVINTLKRMLFEQNGKQRVALVGLGGIGKTQVALHLAHWWKDNQSEYSIFWMPAFSMASFDRACTELVKKLGNWLLILDNADEIGVLDGLLQQPSGILDFLPQSDNGRVLFTTRSQQVAVTAARNAVIRLLEMGQEEATALLKTSLIDKAQLQHENMVTELLEMLTNLPLAIAQAAAYMNINQVSIKEYLRLFRNTDQDAIELLSSSFRDGTSHSRAQGAVATTWIISFNQIRNNNKFAASLLSFIAYIEPKAIPRSLLPKV